jgi:hypothetical protein
MGRRKKEMMKLKGLALRMDGEAGLSDIDLVKSS